MLLQQRDFGCKFESLDENEVVLSSMIAVVEELDKLTNGCGLEISKRRGAMNTTWAVYKRKGNYYLFNINEKFIFDDKHKYSYEKIIVEFPNSIFEIEEIS